MAAAGVLAGPGVISAGVATRDVPPIFQKIVKLLMHSFYDDLARVICDLLARYACVKEDDIALVLRADKKQVRQTLQSLEKDKIFKKQMLQDPNLALTDADVEGVSEEHLRSLQRRASQRYPYYCIDYAAAVNVAKYKFDKMRKALESQSRDKNAGKQCHVCPACGARYDDLETDSLLDPITGDLVCKNFGCKTVLSWDDKAAEIGAADTGSKLRRLNDQVKSIEQLLRQTDGEVIHESALKPPATKKNIKEKVAAARNKPRVDEDSEQILNLAAAESEDETEDSRRMNVQLVEDETSQLNKKKRESAAWFKYSTVASMEEQTAQAARPDENAAAAAAAKKPALSESDLARQLELAMEAEKAQAPPETGAAATAMAEGEDGDDAVEYEDEEEEDEEDEEEDEVMVSVGGLQVPLLQVTDQQKMEMSMEEMDAYSKAYEEYHERMYGM